MEVTQSLSIKKQLWGEPKKTRSKRREETGGLLSPFIVTCKHIYVVKKKKETVHSTDFYRDYCLIFHPSVYFCLAVGSLVMYGVFTRRGSGRRMRGGRVREVEILDSDKPSKRPGLAYLF